MSDTFDRSQLDGKDREQLSEIATALGVKSISRMRKADLIDAIVKATKSSNGAATDAPKPRKVRSTRAAGLDDLASLAEEENALATQDEPDEMSLIRPRRRSAGGGNGAGTGQDAPASATATAPEPTSESPATAAARTGDGSANQGATAEETISGAATAESAQTHQQPPQRHAGQQDQQWRGGDDDGSGNRRRRRRRGRDRGPGEMAGGGQGAQGAPQGGQGRPDRGERNEDYSGELIDVEGLLDLRDEGYGFLRTSGYLAGRSDAYVSASQVRRFGLRKGDYVKGATRPPASSEKYPALVRVDAINGMTPDEARGRVRFEDLTPLFPDSRLRLELDGEPGEITGRIIDLIAPIGKGQRGMIVSPPKAGKTTIIKQIVYSIERNNPETHVIVLLVDERPEEVTDMRRHVLRADVVASTFDRPSDEHCHIAELTIERAKRLVEGGTDVVIILDGITRLARAYNLAAPASGRIMSGGIDAGALYPPKKFFGAARNVEEGGSLTILATALVETNSKMDEHIFEEFKGTGNMELRLDRRTADRRIYPAIDVEQSSTRHEELLFDRRDLQQVWKLRRVLNALEGGSGLELLIDKLRSTKTNAEFLNEIAKAPAGMGT
jgi:transcription termination factor Rho